MPSSHVSIQQYLLVVEIVTGDVLAIEVGVLNHSTDLLNQQLTLNE
jgi:hypothetical protein